MKECLANKEAISYLKDPPEIYGCAYKDVVSAHGAITYDWIFYSRTNQPTGGFNIGSGVFTSPYQGTYTVTVSLRFYTDHGKVKCFVLSAIRYGWFGS